MKLKFLAFGAISILAVLIIYMTLKPASDEVSDLTSKDRPAINIGRVICGGHLPLAIVEKKFSESLKSFTLNTRQYHDWHKVTADMLSGELGGTFILSPLAMKLIREGFPGKIVLASDRNGNGFVLSEKIKSIAALNNTKAVLAVPHIFSQHNVLLHMLLQQHGVALDTVSIVGMPPRDMINSLRRGEIDGFLVGEPEGLKSIDLGVGWLAAISPDIWTDHMDHVFLATDEFIEQQPEKLGELIAALVRGGAFIEANPAEAAIMGEDYTGSPAAVFEKVLTDPPNWITFSDMVPVLSDLQAMSERLVAMGLWADVPADLERYFDDRFVKRAL